jgi:hypothetical protein
MKFHLLIPLLALAGLFVGCDAEQSTQTPDDLAPAKERVADPNAKAALEAQVIGSKLLGNTVRLTGDSFQPADLDFAPEAYFVYYSASW